MFLGERHCYLSHNVLHLVLVSLRSVLLGGEFLSMVCGHEAHFNPPVGVIRIEQINAKELNIQLKTHSLKSTTAWFALRMCADG